MLKAYCSPWFPSTTPITAQHAAERVPLYMKLPQVLHLTLMGNIMRTCTWKATTKVKKQTALAGLRARTAHSLLSSQLTDTACTHVCCHIGAPCAHHLQPACPWAVPQGQSQAGSTCMRRRMHATSASRQGAGSMHFSVPVTHACKPRCHRTCSALFALPWLLGWAEDETS